MFDLICANCETLFQNANRQRKFCSRDCYYAYERGKPKKKWGSEQRICVGCGIEFIVNKSSPRKYCNQDCYHSRKAYHVSCKSCNGIFSAKDSKTKYCPQCLMRICEQCGKEFQLSAAEMEGTEYNVPRKYCSSRCYHDSTKGKPAWNKGDLVELNCSVCGIKFEVWPSRSSVATYCSKECDNYAKSLVTGEDHPLWKGGRDEYGYFLSKNPGSFYRNRVEVLERDDNTCQYCGYQGPSNYMDVHHIIPVRYGGSSKLSNLITLCRKCHNNADRHRIPRKDLMNQVSRKRSGMIRTR